MDRPRLNDQLSVNKIGKNIKKSPLLNPNFANGTQPQPEVYNISKNDLTSVVQELTSSPLRESLPQNPLRNSRFHKIRPAALTPINRPRVPTPMMNDGDKCWLNTAESTVSMYMRYLESSLDDSRTNGNQMQPSLEYQPRPPPPPQSLNHHSPRFNGSSASSSMPILPTPRFNGPPQQMHNNSLPSPGFNGRGILPSPTSQQLLRSPTCYRNFPSPRSPSPLLSPGVRYPSPLRLRNFAFSSMDQPGILGPGKIPRPPAFPGLVFPISRPRWRGY